MSFFGLGGTYAEQQRDKFEKLVNKLSDKIGDLSDPIRGADGEIKKLYKSLISHPESASGKLMTEFNKKVDVWHTEANAIISTFRDAKGQLGDKLSEAQTKYEYWCEEVRKEEEARRQAEAAAAQAVLDAAAALLKGGK